MAEPIPAFKPFDFLVLEVETDFEQNYSKRQDEGDKAQNFSSEWYQIYFMVVFQSVE